MITLSLLGGESLCRRTLGFSFSQSASPFSAQPGSAGRWMQAGITAKTCQSDLAGAVPPSTAHAFARNVFTGTGSVSGALVETDCTFVFAPTSRGLFVLVVRLNLLLLLPLRHSFFFVRQLRPLSGHRYDGIVGFAARNDVHQLQTLARASPIVVCPVRHSRRPLDERR